MLRMSPFTRWILQELEQTVSCPIGRMMMIQNGRNRLAYHTDDARLRDVITREMTFASRSQKAMPRFQCKENRREVAIHSKFEFNDKTFKKKEFGPQMRIDMAVLAGSSTS